MGVWREIVRPKEHGSWSLAFEPVALGLLAAPSPAGAVLAMATVAAFFVRRPLRIGMTDSNPARRVAAKRVALAGGAVVLAAWLGMLFAAGAAWWPWLIPSVVAGACFLWFDLQQSGREQSAEVAGAAAFSFLPAVFAVMAGWTAPAAAALSLVMLARSVPTVLTVRAWLRGRKTGLRQSAAPLIASLAGVFTVAALAWLRVVPWLAVAFLVGFLIRAVILLRATAPDLRASTMGMIEAALGAVYVVAVALSWSAR